MRRPGAETRSDAVTGVTPAVPLPSQHLYQWGSADCPSQSWHRPQSRERSEALTKRHASQRGSKRRSRRTPATSNRRWKYGYLFVHGVGNKRPGDTLKWGHTLVDSIQAVHGWDAAQTYEEPVQDSQGDTPRHAEVKITTNGESHRVLLAEAMWSDLLKTLGKPSAWQTLTFTIKSLPMLAWLIGPDYRDMDALRPDPNSPRRSLKYRIRAACSPLEQFTSPETRMLGRLSWRLATFSAIIYGFALSAFFALNGSSWFGIAAALTVGVFLLWARSRRNVIWHVRVAAMHEDQTEILLTHLHKKISWMEKHCNNVIVIAHSQGGYLIHRVLSSTEFRHPRVRRFVGIGSGLKPITILRAFRQAQFNAAVWASVLSVPALMWSLGPLTWGLIGREISALIHLTYILLHFTIVPVGWTPEYFAQIWEETVTTSAKEFTHVLSPEIGLDFRHGIGLAASLTIVCMARLLLKVGFDTSSFDLSLKRGRGRIEWREYSSPHDMVGRIPGMQMPDGVEQPWVSATGQPFMDHVTYLKSDQVLPRRLVADIFGDLARTSNGCRETAERWKIAVDKFDHARRFQAARRRMFHGLTVGTVSAMLAAPLLARYSSLPVAFVAAWLPLTASLATLSGLFLWVSLRSSKKSAHEFSARLSGERADDSSRIRIRIVPPDRRSLPGIMATMGGLVCFFGLEWFYKASTRLGGNLLWTGYPLLLPLTIGLLLISCAVWAGYPLRKRWPMLMVVCALLALMYSSRSLPGLLPWYSRPEVTLTGLITACSVILFFGVWRNQRTAVDFWN